MNAIDQQVEVGTKIFLRAILILLALVFLYLIRDVLGLVFLAIIVTTALNPAIRKLRKWGMPRTGAVLSVYLLVLLLMGLLMALLVPMLLGQLRGLLLQLPQYVEYFAQFFERLSVGGPDMAFNREQFAVDIRESFSGSVSEIFSTTVGIFSALISFVVFFFLSLYMALEENGVEKFLTSVIPERFQQYSLSVAKRVEVKIGQWLFGQMLSMLLIFFLYWIGLALLGVPYALALALLGGALELVPYVGPVLASVPALLIAFSISPLSGMAVLAFYVVVHQIESHGITPQIMKRAVGINPVAVILALLIGGKLAGIPGVIMAVPAAAVISVFVEDFLKKRTV
jgi:predicted PurR-regulated permease PerM